jgi:transposase
VTHTDRRDPVPVKRAYVFRAYPTRPQEGRAVKLLGDHCDLYNAALEERREAWRMRKASVSYRMQSAQLWDIRTADPGGQGRHSFTAQQQTLRRLSVDVGVARFLTTSDGQVVDNPRFLAVSANLIADLERRKTRARPGSGNRKRLRRALAREWRKVRNRRRDFHHKTARMLIDQCDAIALEDLNMAGMTRRPAPRSDPHNPGAFLPNQAAAKAGLNKSILDAAWHQFTCILTGKAEEAARRVMLVNPAGTSITCHRCGARCARPRQDTVICPACGPMDADVNGAINIASRAGLGSGQAAPAA